MVLRKSYLDKIIPFIDQDLIKVLVGIRRCGKTVLLGQIKDVLLQRNIPAQNIIQANFESMRFRNTRTAETLYDYIAEKAEGCTGKIYILLDEIQEVERWQIAINSLRVDFDCDIYLTGSNSKLLSGELATYLSGRYIQIQVFPFSLAEAKQQCIENGTYTSDEKLFADYLKYGGFPQRFFLPDDHSITTYLDDLYEAIIVRDIMLRHNIREQTALRNVLAFLLDNIGNPFSARNISGRMVSEGIKTTTATVLNYVDYFKEAFMQHRVTGSVQIQNGQTVAFDFIPVSVAIVVDANAPLFTLKALLLCAVPLFRSSSSDLAADYNVSLCGQNGNPAAYGALYGDEVSLHSLQLQKNHRMQAEAVCGHIHQMLSGCPKDPFRPN